MYRKIYTRPIYLMGIETKQSILTDFCNSQCRPKKESSSFQAKEFDRIFDHEEEEILIRSLTGSVKVRNFRHPGVCGVYDGCVSQILHVWKIYLHLTQMYGKCIPCMEHMGMGLGFKRSLRKLPSI